jgi:hypothetical protein
VYKPTVLGTNFTLGKDFAEQVIPVSISVDEFDFTDASPYRVFVQLEPPDIVPTEQKLIDNHTFYDLIMTWNQRVLEGCPHNTVKYIFGTCRWSTDPKDHCDVSKKRFAVSYLTSSKTMCAGHYFRYEIYNSLSPSIGDLEVTKYMSNCGGNHPDIKPVLECKRPLLYPYQYSIVMENGRRNNWITEKLLDCLLSRTIPIYWGAPNVGEYFDQRGILTFENVDALHGILKGLTPEFYQTKLEAIDHNLHEAMKYVDIHARINDEIRRRLIDDNFRAPINQRIGEAVRKRVPHRQ